MEQIFQSLRDDERRIGEEYMSSLTDLNCNSKPLINMLTMLAEENINYAHVIVRVVEFHISQVPPEYKLPILYLIDSIIKNVKSNYVQLFGQCIVNIFLNAFESVLEKVRERMYALRQTWNDVFPPSKLYALDVKVKRLDNNWPVTAKQPPRIHVNPAIHVNPDFLKTGIVPMPVNPTLTSDMEEILQAKTRELLELKKRKLELELEQTKKHLEQQERQLIQATDSISVPSVSLAGSGTVLRTPELETPLGTVPVQTGALYNRVGICHVGPEAPSMMSNMLSSTQKLPTIKPKVHPVNSALLNSVRHRDPRLARQAQSLQSLRNNSEQDPNSVHKQSRSRSKSPLRSSGHSRSNKSKRSASKSSNASSSSSGSERRSKSSSSTVSSSTKGSSFPASLREKYSSRNDHVINGQPTPMKRKSSSPATSPSKSKRNTSQKSQVGASSSRPTRSRSRSPASGRYVGIRNVRRNSNLPQSSTSNEVSTCAISNELDKHKFKILEPGHPSNLEASSMDVDLRPIVASSETAETMLTPLQQTAFPTMDVTTAFTNSIITNAITATASTATSSKLPTKVSFKIQKPLNKFEKSTAHLSTALLVTTTASPSNSASSGKAQTTTLLQGNVCDVKQNNNKLHTANVQSSEKRTSTVLVEEQPQQKRSRSSKLDALFGSEDVDLRKEMPAADFKSGTNSVILVEDDSMENWDNRMDAKQIISPQDKDPLFDALRAKLAKTVHTNNKLSKEGQLTSDTTQRPQQFGVTKLNDDSQEAHEEKVRTILTQAREMYESSAINQEQYRDLLQKVLAINENSKLKGTNRCEPASDEMNYETRERNAARDAVLKKRIPKLKNSETQRNECSLRSEASIYDDPQRQIPDKEPGGQQKSNTKLESKRRKPSKWGEQVDTVQRAAWLANNSHTPSVSGGNNKRSVGSFRGNVNNSNMRMLVATPWQQPFTGLPSMVTTTAPVVASVTSVELASFAGSASNIPPPPQPPSMIALPPLPPALTKAINSLDNPMTDVVRSITIDGGTKEIRFYNQVAIIFMDKDEPHEIGFQNGQRAICIDHNEPLPLSFNDEYKTFTLDGQLHRIRFGFPSRELYIDDHWYEIYFGGPPISLPIGNKLHVLKAEGPPPNVDIGKVRRDLVAGKINMIVDAHNIVPLFLDAKVQTFQLGTEPHQLQFTDSFLYVLLDGKLLKVDYGGLPKSFSLSGRKYFIRFGTLPVGVVAGKTHVQDMIYIKTDAPVESHLLQPTIANMDKHLIEKASSVQLPVSLNIDELFQKLISSGIIGTTTSSSTSVSAPAVTIDDSAQAAKGTGSSEVSVATATSGPIKRVELNKPETIKKRQSGVVTALYLGMQCSSCGLRFPPEQTIKYSQHLDWHFRQNRRERDPTRKATSRKWYYDLTDWMQYEEIEDIDEREKNFMETPLLQTEVADELSNQRSMDSPMPSCAASADDVDRACDMCHEKFEQFYNEELEEWHLRAGIRVDGKIYHPLCYDDYKSSLNPLNVKSVEADTSVNVELNNADDNATDALIKMESVDQKVSEDREVNNVDEDDDDVIVLPNEEPSVTEIVDDDDEYVPVNATDEKMSAKSQSSSEEDRPPLSQNESAAESDVEIQEPHIPFTDLDTYVEKELPPMDDSVKAAFLNVKIKEEPKEDEEDEDDGFEDVGTVILQPPTEDEIYMDSSETLTQTIASSASPVTLDRPPSTGSLALQSKTDELELEQAHDLNSSIDGNNDRQEIHNLSASGPLLALPLASIVNKIKINITKNTSSNSNNSASNNNNTITAISLTAGTSDATSNLQKTAEPATASAITVIGGGGIAVDSDGQVNAIETISTIPVLCSGNTFVPKITSTISSNSPVNISSISVIGSSYSNTSRFTKSGTASTPIVAVTTASAPAKVKTPPPVQNLFDLKPTLRNATLKKTRRVQSGVDTSGLCSIM
ncbi:uncharacterized protein LOC115624980 isoform X2 [Scaptodrosophila lebanonensis]|uniref:Pre-mRNA cleavage complex 2 protein Pcf11 n=1 Tax=Drosophila lebanonensis TaxID=7225 RepID=A0A6J2TG36_DROLE|nr:uncharacterized protein LOC115624980 isoform X2 [Scaptodrosophila lebanonensis]